MTEQCLEAGFCRICDAVYWLCRERYAQTGHADVLERMLEVVTLHVPDRMFDRPVTAGITYVTGA